jgi:hypothetical protein
MTRSSAPVTPHLALKVWAGKWRAEGTSYRDGRVPWVSDEDYEMLAGDYYLVQRWNANVGGAPFVGIGVIGYDEAAKRYVSRSFENHGRYRNYAVQRDGDTWTFEGETERARYDFSRDGRSCDIKWEFKPDGRTWKPLCDRTAKRVD